jgi:hypothetical protein
VEDQQGPDSGNVDWGDVGRQMLIGGISGAIGGGVAGVAAKLAPSATRIASSVTSWMAASRAARISGAAERVATAAIGKGGQPEVLDAEECSWVDGEGAAVGTRSSGR